MNEKKTTGILTFDIEKAFDRVWHEGLLVKMISKKFPDYLIKILHSFLKDRKFKVCIGQYESCTVEFALGVPQESALSPTLYNITPTISPLDFLRI